MDVASILGGNWVFRVEHKGITIHSSKVEGSEVLGFRGEVDIDASFRKMIALFHDMENYRRWVHQLDTMEVLERREGLEYVVRQVLNAPWPLQKREMIVRTELAPAGENAVAVTMAGEPDLLPPSSGLARVRDVRGAWIFEPTERGGTRLTFVMHVDPGRDVPSGVSNQAMFEVPFYSLNNLRSLATDPSYDPPYPAEVDEHLSIIEDPDGNS